MGARSKIIDLNRSSAEVEPADDIGLVGVAQSAADEQIDYQEMVHESHNQAWDDEDAQPSRNFSSPLVIALFGALFLAWTGFFAWAHLGELTGGLTPTRIAELVIGWSVPTCLIMLGWLLAMRLSSREAKRFGDVARLLREESLSLEDRMRRVNGEIALARSFLAENARELETVGRTSAQRLTDAAQTLGSALSDSDERAKMLEVASNAAVTNLEQLRNHLPVVTSAAKDATNQIGIAGNTAHSQIQAILATLNRVTETSEKTGEELGRIDSRIGQSADMLENRIAASADRLAKAVESSRETAIPLFSELDRHIGEIEQRISQASAATGDQLADNEVRLAAIMAGLQENTEKLQSALSTHDEAAQESIIRLSGFVEETRNSLVGMDKEASESIAQLAFAVTALVESNGDLTGKLLANRDLTKDFIAESANLLDLLRQAEAEASDKLPDAFSSLRSSFDQSQRSMEAVAATIVETDRQCSDMTNRIADLDKQIASQNSAIAALSETAGTQLQQQHGQIKALSAALSQTREQIEDMVERVNDQLIASMQKVHHTTKEAADASRKIIDDELAEISGSISERNSSALRAAIETQIQSLDGAMRESLERNLSFADSVEKRAASQLERLGEMAANLEQRIATAHNNFTGLDDEGFARRMALLTESLNSAAIDVAKILSNEVTDTAWAAYLKGDRGVFTRRAVKLLDSTEAKIIASNYDEDTEFRDNVNRYIHDFESMMRVLLSTRDGNAIGVTLLSSDVGKLYVALAQAIERLRN